MGKQLIERIAPLVQAALEQDYLFPAQGGRKSLAESITALVIARIDAERWKDAVAFRMIDGDDVEYNGIDQFSCGRAGGEPLFLSPTPTIPEGMALVPIEPTEAMMQVHDDLLMQGVNRGRNVIYAAMIAAAQGERNAD